jgi:hypothetical protein
MHVAFAGRVRRRERKRARVQQQRTGHSLVARVIYYSDLVARGAAAGGSVLALWRLQRQRASALPNPARVVLAAGDHSVAFVVERARENFVDVSFEDLQALASLYAPHAARLVAGRCGDG